MVQTVRIPFTERDDDYLAQYIAKYNPEMEGRKGNALYERLVEDKDKKWKFAKRHTAQSWRDRYVKNRDYFDTKIQRIIQAKQEKQAALQPSSSQAPKPASRPQPEYRPAPAPSPSQKRARVNFTPDDDQKIVGYLASCDHREGKRLGQKLWVSLEDTDEYPWAKRHSWQSWRERYKKNELWFKWAIRKQMAEDSDDDDEPTRPRYLEEPTVRRKSSQQRMTQSPEKRKRISESGESPPRKKSRVQQRSVSKREREPVAGPSTPRRTGLDPASKEVMDHVTERPEGVSVSLHEVEVAEGDTADAEVADAETEPQEDSTEEHPDRGSNHDGSDGEDSDEEEDLGPPGPEDYHGEIFEPPSRTEDSAPVPKRTSASGSDSSEADKAELFKMLTDNDVQDYVAQSDDDMEIDDVANKTLVELGGDDENQNQNEDISALSDTPPPGASPPPRKHNARIEHDIEADPGTSSVSPTEAADIRHRLERSHSPAPPRKHPKRIRRISDEDFFGTPTSAASSPSGSLPVNSPTTQHLAHVSERRSVDRGERERAREPPRLDEGPWNKAYSDARGKSRAGLSGKARRKSGVDFEEEAEIIGTQDSIEQSSEDDNMEADEETPMPWPPVRRKDKEKTSAPATPSHTKTKGKARMVANADGADPGRLVTTEKIVMTTVRTVQRVPRTSKGTPYSASGGSPRTAPSHNSTDSSSSPGAFPRIGASSGAPISKAAMASFQKMLRPEGEMRKGAPPESSPSKAERDAKRIRSGPLSTTQRNSLAAMLGKGGKDGNRKPAPGHASIPIPSLKSILSSHARATMSPPAMARDHNGERFDRFEEHDQELPTFPLPPLAQSSPLGDKIGSRDLNDLVPYTSTSHTQRIASTGARPNNGKGRADAPLHVPGHPRQHTLGGPEAQATSLGRQDSVPRPRPLRQFLPAFDIGDDFLAQSSALSLLSNLHRSGSAHSRSYSLANPPGSRSSRHSLSPLRSVDASLVRALPPNEAEIVMEVGMQAVLRIMALNHGFSEDTVRRLYESARSLEKTDDILRRMREKANDTGNEVLQALAGGDQSDDDDDVQEQEDGDDTLSVAHQLVGEVEDEQALVQDSWMYDELPLAESSRLDVSHANSSGNFRSDSRNRNRTLRITRVDIEPAASVQQEYSPPKHTRAAKHIKKQSLEHGRARGQGDLGVDAGGSPGVVGQRQPSAELKADVEPGELARISHDQWRRLGSGGAKIVTGKALGKLLK
ncbi:hypothetical protein C8Q74DRAFT_1362278 [Fomes fomentarius]|nr:hypothetical protein C8Q74DRAFT_1362278 [Fomes fomentarius]